MHVTWYVVERETETFVRIEMWDDIKSLYGIYRYLYFCIERNVTFLKHFSISLNGIFDLTFLNLN